jgi:hypothetical protein
VDKDGTVVVITTAVMGDFAHAAPLHLGYSPEPSRECVTGLI